MARSREPYRDLTYSLRKFRGQVSESIAYALEYFPSLDSPEKIFNYLKPRLTYKNDPKGVELFQTLETLLDNNRHGITGAGDCDCFTIAALGTLIANGFTNVGIILAGRNLISARHIYAYVDQPGKPRQFLDLTNRVFNYERFYPYKQAIPYVLNQTEKNMILELADGNGYGHSAHPYIHFKNKGVQVREDYFDNMGTGEFQRMCLSEGIPQDEIFELCAGRAQRQANRQSGELKPRQQRKQTKKANKPRNVRKQTNADSKGDKRRMTGQSKIDRANKPRPARSTPALPSSPYSPSPYEYTDYEEVENEEVDNEEFEPSPDEEFEAQMEENFTGMADIGPISVPKLLLWGVGLTALGTEIGYRAKAKGGFNKIFS